MTMEAMRELIDDEYEDESAADLIGKIKNGIEHWLTAVSEPGVELTTTGLSECSKSTSCSER